MGTTKSMMGWVFRGVLGLSVLVVALVAIEFALGPITIDNLVSARMIHAGAADDPPDESVVYKRTPTRPLSMHVFRGSTGASGDAVEDGATILLIHGGGFHSGWPDELYPLASRLAEAGHTVFLPEYRLQRADGVAYAEEFDDCRDAIEWVEDNGRDYGANPRRLVLGGSSAGAHLAAAMVTLEDPEGRSAPSPIGMILTAPYLDSADASARMREKPPRQGPISGLLGPSPRDVFEGESEKYSPRAHLRAGLPPMLVMAGEEDRLWPPAREFCEAVERQGGECSARGFPGATHGFALESRPDHEAVVEAARSAVRGWLERSMVGGVVTGAVAGVVART